VGSPLNIFSRNFALGVSARAANVVTTERLHPKRWGQRSCEWVSPSTSLVSTSESNITRPPSCVLSLVCKSGWNCVNTRQNSIVRHGSQHRVHTTAVPPSVSLSEVSPYSSRRAMLSCPNSASSWGSSGCPWGSRATSDSSLLRYLWCVNSAIPKVR
jgi:hypothetical protein